MKTEVQKKPVVGGLGFLRFPLGSPPTTGFSCGPQHRDGTMKHVTPDLMKFKRLQRSLGESLRSTVGILELLWIATQKNAPAGDIGKFSDEEISTYLSQAKSTYDQIQPDSDFIIIHDPQPCPVIKFAEKKEEK